MWWVLEKTAYGPTSESTAICYTKSVLLLSLNRGIVLKRGVGTTFPCVPTPLHSWFRLQPSSNTKYCSDVLRDAGTGVHDGGTAPPALWIGGSTGTHVPLHNSIISNFMIYQDRLETNLLQLFAHT